MLAAHMSGEAATTSAISAQDFIMASVINHKVRLCVERCHGAVVVVVGRLALQVRSLSNSTRLPSTARRGQARGLCTRQGTVTPCSLTGSQATVYRFQETLRNGEETFRWKNEHAEHMGNCEPEVNRAAAASDYLPGVKFFAKYLETDGFAGGVIPHSWVGCPQQVAYRTMLTAVLLLCISLLCHRRVSSAHEVGQARVRFAKGQPAGLVGRRAAEGTELIEHCTLPRRSA